MDVQLDAARPHLLSRYGVTLRGNVTSVDPPLGGAVVNADRLHLSRANCCCRHFSK